MFMDAKLSSDKKFITITTPPNNKVFPPGPGTWSCNPQFSYLLANALSLLGYIFITIDNVTSEGTKILVGSGQAPPVADQGVPL